MQPGLFSECHVDGILYVQHKKDKRKKTSKGPSIEELRKERLKRENESHTKAELLLRTTAV